MDMHEKKIPAARLHGRETAKSICIRRKSPTFLVIRPIFIFIFILCIFALFSRILANMISTHVAILDCAELHYSSTLGTRQINTCCVKKLVNQTTENEKACMMCRRCSDGNLEPSMLAPRVCTGAKTVTLR